MTKKELVTAIAADAGLSIKDAGKALNAFVGAFGKSMKKGQRIQLPGLGTFKVDKRSAQALNLTFLLKKLLNSKQLRHLTKVFNLI
jgi:nucleoid DNA-binding protein